MSDLKDGLGYIRGTMALSGMPLTEEETARLAAVMDDPQVIDEAIQTVLEQYTSEKNEP